MSPSDVFEPAEFASVFFFLFLCKKRERKKGNAGRRCWKNNAAEARACKPGVPTCVFLSEKSTLLRVRGAMPWARIFFVYGRAAEKRRGAGDGPAAARAKSLRAEQCGRSGAQRCAGKGKKDVFLFLGGKNGGRLPILQVEVEVGSQLSLS